MSSVDEKSREWTEIFSLTADEGEIKIKSERVWVVSTGATTMVTMMLTTHRILRLE